HRYDGVLRRRIPERLPLGVPVTFPAKHAEARDLEPRERGAYEIGNGAEVFGDDFRSGLAEQLEDAIAERQLCLFASRRERRFAAAGARSRIGAVEADQVIDPVAVVERRAASSAVAQPAKITGGDDVPPVRRHPPVLSGGAEGVGWHAYRRVELEFVLA